VNTARAPLGTLPALVLSLLLLLGVVPAASHAADPDPMQRGPYATTTLDPFTAGTVNLQEPNSAGGGTTGAASAASLQIRGSLYRPSNRTEPSPVIVYVHGNHGSCDTGSAPNCSVFKRNDRGYAYVGENLASWGYTVVSIDQDQLMYYQDSAMAKGMHQRRLLIAATLDALYKANAEGLGSDTLIGDSLVGTLDFTRIGLMGHSRGGDAVTSFIDYNRTRPEPGRRYPLRGVIALAPVDYERRAPTGTPFMSILPMCDADVSNLQGARFFERGQYRDAANPFPLIQVGVHGTNHNWFNSVWSADGEDGSNGDQACGVNMPNNIRLSGGKSILPLTGSSGVDDGWSDGGTYTRTNRGSGDPELMGDQERVGLALMNSFFRRYVGGEGGFNAYMTGERLAQGKPELPETACPDQVIQGQRNPTFGTNGPRLACAERTLTSYFPPATEREDVIRPEPDTPLTASAVGTALNASGFSNPFLDAGGVSPKPLTTVNGIDWCNPEPDHFAPAQLGRPSLPTATKACPLPAVGALGGQSGIRENGPVNQSYGLQLAVAWDDPVAATGKPASLSTRIPAAKGDVSGKQALALAAAVNFFDPRNFDPMNPDRAAVVRTGSTAEHAPDSWTQDFTIAVTDAAGREATVSAADQRYGNALHPSVGSTTSKTHVILHQIRVPLGDLAAQGLDLTQLRQIELRFGEAGKPAQGSIQLADVRFQEAAAGTAILKDSDGGSGPATGASVGGPDPLTLLAAAPRASAEARPDAIGVAGSIALSSATRCVDTKAPSVSVSKLAVRKGRLTVQGRATDVGCAATRSRSSARGGVRSVQVTLSTPAPGGTCRFVRGNGKLSAPLPCSSPVGLVASGKTSWKLRTSGALPKGSYRMVVRAFDASGNQRQTKTRTVRVG